MGAFSLRLALAALLVPCGAGAQSLTMTEAEALAQLAPENPRVQAARAAVDVARADVLAAGRWPNPRVTFNREEVAGIAEDMVTVSQTLPVTGQRQLAVSAASARADASASRAEERVRRLRADLRLAFARLQTAQVRERELARARDRLRDLGDVLGRREAAGEAAGFDLLRAERDVLDVDADRALAAASRLRAEAEVASFFAAPLRTGSIEAVAADRPRREVPALDDLVARAGQRGEVVALQQELAAAAFAERAALRRRLPEPELVAGTKSSSLGDGDVGTVFSVHATIPLFDRSTPERAAAQARQRQMRAEADALQQTLRGQIAAWRSAVIERRAVADRYRAAVTGNAGDIERIAQVSYEAGERGILEVLDAYHTGTSARVRLAELDAAVREAEIELEFISGWEMP